MQQQRLGTMMEATRLTREGKLAEATALLQGGPVVQGVPPRVEEQRFRPPRPEVLRQRYGAFAGGLRGSTQLEELLSRLRNGRGALDGYPAAEPGPQLPGRWLEGSYANRAGEREYRLYVPSGYDGQTLPLITMLHGGTQTAEDFAAGTRMNELAERHRFLVVYPEQSATANPMRYWNWFQRAHQHRDTGEPSLIAGLTRKIVADYAIETARVYVAGFSAGAAMASVMAACYPDVYAAVGVHSGLAYGVATDVVSAFNAMKHGAPAAKRGGAGSIPLIVFHGDGDSTVDQVNAECLVEARLRSAGAKSAGYRQRSSSGEVSGGRRYSQNLFIDSEGMPVVEQWTVHQGGHAWAGGSPRGSYTDPLGPDASAEFVRFFHRHTNAAVHRQRPRRRRAALPEFDAGAR
jgi:poly(hydroxyalkanoate) depolymerase family esterase